jgi:hypothetical protein
MNCSEWEEKVALYAGGDLAPADGRALEGHLAECAGCQLLLSGLRQTLELAREAHGDPIDAAHYAAVRARVLAELRQAPARRWRFAWVYAMAAAAVVLGIMMWPRPELRLALPVPHTPAAPAIAKVELPKPAPPRSVHPGEPILMQIQTDNPDVVIYWMTETKGETK